MRDLDSCADQKEEVSMNGNMFGVVLFFLAMVVVSKLMALPQIHRLNKQLLKIKRSGPVSSVGLARSWRGNRAYVLITDEKGNIMRGYQTSGNTVFSGFQEDTGLKETTYLEIMDNLSKKKKLTRIEQAKQMAAEYLESGLEKENGPQTEE